MKHTRQPHMRTLLLACCLAAAYPAAHAEETATTTDTTATTTTTTGTSTATTAVGTSTTTEARLSAEFADFLGGEEQAGAAVSGLRQGTAFSLDAAPADATAGTDTTASATIDPPTGTMGYGNVRITLRLAQAELNQMGITQPTTEELSAVLLGGEINGTQVDGILTLRAEGMGWGQIARQYGMTVGQIMGKGRGLTQTTGKAATVSGSTKTAHASQAHANGYIPDSSTTIHGAHAHSNGYIPSGKPDAGIVTAAGASTGGAASGMGKGQSHKTSGGIQSAGAVSAGGQHVSLAGAGNPGGDTSATAPGQARKN